MKTKTAKHDVTDVVISPPKFQTGIFHIEGISPFVQLKFSEKQKREIQKKHEAGSVSKKGKKREARNFDEEYENAKHKTASGKCGIPAPAFRNAMISACRICGFQMTKGKLSIFIEADDIDVDEGTPLVYIEGKPEKSIMPVRNETGVVDLRSRAMWRQWSAKVKIRWDADMFSVTDIGNLLARAGLQVGLGEGRPDSKKSCGMGWGMFKIKENKN